MEFAPGFDELALLWAASAGEGRDRLLDALAFVVARTAFVDGRPVPRSAAEFHAARDRHADAVLPAAHEAVARAVQLHRRSLEVREALEGSLPRSWLASASDIERHRVRLAAAATLEGTPWQRLADLVRYMSALAVRAGKLRTRGPERDAAAMAEIARWEDELAMAEATLAAEGHDGHALEAFRALVEEYRVSLFAQEVRTPVPVSAQRLERAWRDRGLPTPGLG